MIQSDPRITTPETPPPPPHCLVFGSKMIRITHPENPPPPLPAAHLGLMKVNVQMQDLFPLL